MRIGREGAGYAPGRGRGRSYRGFGLGAVMVVLGGVTLRASGGAPGAKPAEPEAQGGAEGQADCIGQEIKS